MGRQRPKPRARPDTPHPPSSAAPLSSLHLHLLHHVQPLAHGCVCALAQLMCVPCWRVAVAAASLGLHVWVANHPWTAAADVWGSTCAVPPPHTPLTPATRHLLALVHGAGVAPTSPVGRLLAAASEDEAGEGLASQPGLRRATEEGCRPHQVRAQAVLRLQMVQDTCGAVAVCGGPGARWGTAGCLPSDAVFLPHHATPVAMRSQLKVLRGRRKPSKGSLHNACLRWQARLSPAPGPSSPAPTVCAHPGPCRAGNVDWPCPCADAGVMCSKHCACWLECPRRFLGCDCGEGGCGPRCTCRMAQRECDPDLCACAQHEPCQAGAGHCRLPQGATATAALQTAAAAAQQVTRHPPLKSQQRAAACPQWSAEVQGALLARLQGGAEGRARVDCGNASMTLGWRVHTKVARSTIPHAGFGLFALQRVAAGQLIGTYSGEVISQLEAERRGSIYDHRNRSYIFHLNDGQCLDATRRGCKLRFANHSANPNCVARVVRVRDHDMAVGIFALTGIAPHTELTFDYGYSLAVSTSTLHRHAATHVGWAHGHRPKAAPPPAVGSGTGQTAAERGGGVKRPRPTTAGGERAGPSRAKAPRR